MIANEFFNLIIYSYLFILKKGDFYKEINERRGKCCLNAHSPLTLTCIQGELSWIVSITNGEYVIIVAITNNRDGHLGSPF
jgi:hypothetical protein